MMTPEQRKEIEERVAAATPGPWTWMSSPDRDAQTMEDGYGPIYVVGGLRRQDTPESSRIILDYELTNRDHTYGPGVKMYVCERADAELIAHARTDIPALLSALDAAEARAKAAEERVRELEGVLAEVPAFVEIGATGSLKRPKEGLCSTCIEASLDRYPNLAKWLRAKEKDNA